MNAVRTTWTEGQNMTPIEPGHKKPQFVYLGGDPNRGVTSLSFGSPSDLSGLTIPSAPVDALTKDLATLGDQVRALKNDVAGKKDLAALNERLGKMAASIERATERSQELKANIVLPPSKYLSVRLVPSHSLDRLEEYRSDEKKAYALLGVFGGGAIGVFINWATQDTFALTKATIVLVVFFLILTTAAVAWAWQIGRRVQRVRKAMLPPLLQDTPGASLPVTGDPDVTSGAQDCPTEAQGANPQPASGEGG
jgi:hypothetical protein